MKLFQHFNYKHKIHLSFSLSSNDHMSTTTNKKSLLKTICKANNVIGCGCGKPKLSDVHEPTPIKPKKSSNTISSHNTKPSSATSSTPIVMEDPDYTKVSKVPSPCPKIADSVAIVKDSNDPYEDFRHSMLQMIMEKEIYSRDDLKELLNCFLGLNSPCHHDIIVQAFTGIWNEAVSERPHSEKPNVLIHDQSHES